MAQFAAAGRGGEKVGGVVIEVHYHPPAISAKKHRPIMVSPIFKTEAKTMGPENCPVSTLARRQKTSSHNIWMMHDDASRTADCNKAPSYKAWHFPSSFPKNQRKQRHIQRPSLGLLLR